MNLEFKYDTIYDLNDLISTIKYYQLQVNFHAIEKAYEFAKSVHEQSFRKNGDTVLSHVLTVANYLAELKLDETSIICGLLHDTVEKGGINIDTIDKNFGTTIAFIIDGVNTIRKFSKNIVQDIDDRESLKQLIFNSAEDVRILIVRIAEKLHNLLTTIHNNFEETTKAAQRALLIYAPLSEYLNITSFQKKFEDKAFEILHPEEYKFISKQVHIYYSDSKNLITKFEENLRQILSKYSIKNFSISSRKKGLYSIYRKIKKKYAEKYGGLNEQSFARVLDIYAARILVNTVEECYMVLGLIQSNFEILQEEFTDYIADPKENGYQSIHVIVKFEEKTLEIQIRTFQMHEINEYGSASHIAYKSKGSVKTADMTWTKDLVKWQGNTEKEVYKLKAFSNSIFVFTPKGLVIRLEKGSTPIDFAFRIHTDIGKHYVGAKVNGKMVNMSTELNTGDVVEIITQKRSNVSIDWINYAKMSYTKNRIRRCINNSQN